ncbi:M20 aminoacylase family protein [Gemmobacter nectariphilus]|uniref:M20 aminoacylase family protein n=1 Tax=Gemmobacter nectariphilus TaxID=220343 RepID=UPI00040A4351|nr:M20 aminoacylase family protein [Gemmobacter nectariphilus]
MPVKNRIAEMQPEIAAWRRDFHENPELLYEVHRTAGVVADRLRAFGCDEVVTGIGRTGVVGVIRGRQTGSGRVVGLRADMDALPITETTGLPHASKTPGVMHACGHDGHTAMLLGAAQYLAETRNFDGTVVVMFQPAEEGGAGARAMCQDGMMDRWGVQEVYGMHNWPGIPAGQFAIRPGPFFAATNTFTITITGRGGHAAKPHDTVDPTVVASQIVLALQSIASRNADPLDSIVVSVTSFVTSSQAFNVIPQSVQLKGTVRTLLKETRAQAEQRIRAIVGNTAAAYGATADIDYIEGYPVMANHPDETDHARAVAAEISGQPVLEVAPTMGGEDFAYMLEERPGAYILVGNGDTASVHHPDYDFDDSIIPAGSSWYVGMAESRMPVA